MDNSQFKLDLFSYIFHWNFQKVGKDLGHSFIKAQVVECVTVTLIITQSFARIFVDYIKLISGFFFSFYLFVNYHMFTIKFMLYL